MVEREQPSLPLTRRAELLSLSRSGLYYVPTPVSAAEVAIKHAIDKIHTQYPFYGSRRITVELRAQHHLQVARETIQRSMRDMGIADSANNPAGDFHVLSDEVRLNWLPATYTNRHVYWETDYTTVPDMRAAIKSAFTNSIMVQWLGHASKFR